VAGKTDVSHLNLQKISDNLFGNSESSVA